MDLEKQHAHQVMMTSSSSGELDAETFGAHYIRIAGS